MKKTIQITQPEYTKPTIILATIAGAIMMVACIMYLAGAGFITPGRPPYIQIFLAVVALVFLPITIYTSSVKSYKASQRIQEPIEYNFTHDKLTITGSTFKGEREWGKTYKILELKNYFLIYENNMVFNLIVKTAMSPAEVSELREILRNVTIAGTKHLFSS